MLPIVKKEKTFSDTEDIFQIKESLEVEKDEAVAVKRDIVVEKKTFGRLKKS
jgi:hypothetical protein